MAMQTIQQFFEHELRDVYFAEQKLSKALGKMSKHVSNPELKRGFIAHQKETDGHVKRLEKVFKLIDKSPRGIKCEGILGLIAEHDLMMEEKMSDEVNTLMHIGSSIKVERYEITAYESLIQLAQTMPNMEKAVDLLRANLNEEFAMLEKLQQLSGAGSTMFTGGDNASMTGLDIGA